MMQEIKELATKFRIAIESAKNERRFTDDQCFRNFPSGCCGITAELLAQFLMDNDIKSKLTYIGGTCRDYSLELQSHAWLKIEDNIVVDITIDQFKCCLVPFVFNETVYVGLYNDFYNQFEIDVEEICNNYYPLEDMYIRNHLSRRKLYEIILEYIK
ncbi:hypothetical protein [Clostridium estertheticum]|uniref:hypothetical protein n=1 Tax=Clostridium estertheticum TaxID=238834 RepID=UPI001CF10BDF|nr:hypothetical protein [Clostridium estertheticum]MCB2353919.1 hypothetical protein [Clostridium estertheticum]WAG43060.1 hypothetical protein LL065_10420 [Clostridium estertheticum]